MKNAARLFLLLIAFVGWEYSAQAQGARYDSVAQTSVTVEGVTAVTTMPGARITVCGFPAVGATSTTACTNKISTYTDQTLGVLCPANAQAVLTGTSSCVAAADNQGNFGFWAPLGQYSYSICGAAPASSCATYWTNGYSGEQARRLADRFPGADAVAQIINAMADLPSAGGVVDARNLCVNGTDLTSTSATTITLGSASTTVILLLGNCRILSNANPVVLVPGPSWVIGNASLGGTGQSGLYSTSAGGTVVKVTGNQGGAEGVFLNVSPSGAGKGLYLQASGTTGVSHNSFRNLRINGPTAAVAGSAGLVLEASSATALVDHNEFDTIWVSDFAYAIKLQTSGSAGPTDNTFINMHPQNYTGAPAGQGIDIASGALNQFFGGEGEGFATGINVEAGASYNSFFGYRAESNSVDITDNGTGTMFIGLSLSAASIQGTDASRTVIGQGNVAVLQQLPASLAVAGKVQASTAACSSAAPCFSASDDVNTGYSIVAADHTLRGYSAGAGVYLATPTRFRIGSGSEFGWTSGADPTTSGEDTGISRVSAGVAGVGNGTPGDTSGIFKAAAWRSNNNCLSSAGSCGAATAGRVSIAAGATTVTVSTSNVTAASEIFVQEDMTLGADLGVTCNATTGRIYTVTSRSAGVSFVITASAAPAVTPACLTFHIIN